MSTKSRLTNFGEAYDQVIEDYEARVARALEIQKHRAVGQSKITLAFDHARKALTHLEATIREVFDEWDRLDAAEMAELVTDDEAAEEIEAAGEQGDEAPAGELLGPRGTRGVGPCDSGEMDDAQAGRAKGAFQAIMGGKLDPGAKH